MLDIEMDSLTQVSILSGIEAAYRVELPGEEMLRLVEAADLRGFIAVTEEAVRGRARPGTGS